MSSFRGTKACRILSLLAEIDFDQPEFMKAILRLTRLALVAVCLTSCAGLPDANQNASADHGPYPSNYQEIVHRWIATTFFDPHSVQDLTISKPTKGWKTGSPLFGEPSVTYGWEIIVKANGKNRFGGYTGLQTYDLIIRNGVIVYDGTLGGPGV